MANLPGISLRDQSYTGRKYEPGSEVIYSVYLPPAALQAQPGTLALYLFLEYLPDSMSSVLSQLMDDGVIPPGMMLFSDHGRLSATLPGGANRDMRAEEFDQYGSSFSDFLVEELIPEAAKKVHAELSPSPDMHMIAGSSSGGMMSWNAVWFRNDYFRRCFLCSPTFSAIRGGEEPMVLLRKTETRPIRVYMTAGSEEPDYFFGSSLFAVLNAAHALEFAGYDYRFEQFIGQGHSCFRADPSLWRRVAAFLWANWRTEPVKTLGNQIRIRKLVADGSTWKKTEESMPDKKAVITQFGTFSFAAGTIFLERDGVKKVAANGFGHITSLCLSTDKWRLYVADRDRRFLYALSIMPDGSLAQQYKLAPLHLAHDCRILGALDMDILADDRVLSATELGIQGTVSFGLTDLILPLPGDLPADGVAVRGNMLYASSRGIVFRRTLKIGESVSAEPVKPTSPEYSDGFRYERSHHNPPF